MNISCHREENRLFFALLVFIFSLSLSRQGWAQSDLQESHPGLGAEVRYAEAVIAYNRHQIDQSLKILDELLAQEPSKKEYLEMKALALKGTQAPEKSIEVYQKLYDLARDEDRGPYAFELGTLLNQQNKIDEARPYFQKAIDLGFNTGVSHFYLGLGFFQQTNYMVAERHFEIAVDSGLVPFSVIGRYYLAVCFFKLKNASLGIQELMEVKHETATVQSGDPVFAIAEATDKMLIPFSKGHWFGNLLLQSQYDSNIQQLPAGASNPTAGVNPATMKMIISGGGGYMSAPADPIQWVANYHAGYNYNFNSETKGFEYFTNNASVYANYHALERTSGGVKVDTTYVFQNSLVDPTQANGSYEYQKYDSTLGGGPYFRHQINREWKLEAEMGIHSQTFYIDPNLSGTRYDVNVMVQDDRRGNYFNPGANVLFESNKANGTEYIYSGYGLGVTDSMSFAGSISVLAAIDWMATKYTQSVPLRNDQNFSFKVSGTKLLSGNFSLLCDLNYVTNSSTLASSYSYHELTTSIGAGYSF